MEDFYINNTSQMESNNSNVTFLYDDDYSDYNYTYNYTYDHEFTDFIYTNNIAYVITCIIISIGLPLTLLAIYSLYSQIKNDHVAPIFIINLLISDIIQLCTMIVIVAEPEDKNISHIFSDIYLFGLVSSVCFMVCIAMERYLVIAWLVWYHFRRTIKITLVVSAVVWILALVYVLLHLGFDYGFLNTIKSILLFVPCPLLIFFLVWTLKVLSAAISVPSDEKIRIVGILVLVLLIYTLLFLPTIIVFLKKGSFQDTSFRVMLLRFSPLADLILYVFMRKGVIDKLLASLCCCRMDSDDNSRSSP